MKSEKNLCKKSFYGCHRALLSNHGISLSKQMDLRFSINPYTYQLCASGNADKDTLSLIKRLLNEGNNAKNLWTHAWIKGRNQTWQQARKHHLRQGGSERQMSCNNKNN